MLSCKTNWHTYYCRRTLIKIWRSSSLWSRGIIYWLEISLSSMPVSSATLDCLYRSHLLLVLHLLFSWWVEPVCSAVNISLSAPFSPPVTRGCHLLPSRAFGLAVASWAVGQGMSRWMSLTHEKFQKPDGVTALIFSVLFNWGRVKIKTWRRERGCVSDFQLS